MQSLLIWGAGDQGTVTLDCALAMKKYAKIDFLDFKEKGHRKISDYLIYKEDEVPLNKIIHAYDEVIVATGSNDLRESKLSLLTAMGIPLATLIHPTAVISPFAKISKGCTVLPLAVVHTNASIGTGCIINTGVIVEHDCCIGDYVNISPKAAMAGHTKIGTKAFLGTGCTIINDITIGKETTIGAGAAVIHDIPDYAVAVGVPAKIIKQNKNLCNVKP